MYTTSTRERPEASADFGFTGLVHGTLGPQSKSLVHQSFMNAQTREYICSIALSQHGNAKKYEVLIPMPNLEIPMANLEKVDRSETLTRQTLGR